MQTRHLQLTVPPFEVNQIRVIFLATQENGKPAGNFSCPCPLTDHALEELNGIFLWAGDCGDGDF